MTSRTWRAGVTEQRNRNPVVTSDEFWGRVQAIVTVIVELLPC
jgi:hypothetical protein